MTRASAAAIVLSAAAGLALGACGGSLYDPDRIPTQAAGAGLTCTDPATLACGTACVPRDLTQCEACGVPCAAPASATATCQPAQPGGAYACGFRCDPGFFAAGSSCIRALEVAAGGNHGCAILEDHSLTCWGWNSSGQVDPASAATSFTSPRRTLASGVTHVALGFHHTCAVQAGVVKCWGANDQGQLGGAGGPDPVTVAGLSSPDALAAGANHTCAIVGGRVRCWGGNVDGQLGDGTVGGFSAAVVDSGVASAASTLASLVNTTCALVSGAVKCWGANESGQTGLGSTTTPRATPDPVPLPTTAVSIAVGQSHACATLQTGAVFCWGSNGSTQLASNLAANPQLVPIQASRVDAGARSVAVAASAATTCSLKDTLAEVRCSGANEAGQAGATPLSATADGTITTLGTQVLRTVAGLKHFCALVDETPGATPTRVVKCWGRNAEGQLGRATIPAGSGSASPDFVGP